MDANMDDPDIPQHERIKAVLEEIYSHASDKSPEWWAEFDEFMKENRFNIPERDFWNDWEGF